ncbi:hypothetical protein M885DRAFT_519149 [Pelagophyceae sp. CCMP2097]|nr:hypothetical protein M885DRAFT_519149 [Pelagophyceae sp. CCMP2097]
MRSAAAVCAVLCGLCADAFVSPRPNVASTLRASPLFSEKPRKGAEMNTVNAKLLAKIKAKQLPEEILGDDRNDFVETDISDVDPAVTIFGAILSLAMGYALWQGTLFMLTSFNDHPVSADYYPIARASGIMRTTVVAIGALLTGLTVFAGIGVLALGIKVAVDPPPPPSATPLSDAAEAASAAAASDAAAADAAPADAAPRKDLKLPTL